MKIRYLLTVCCLSSLSTAGLASDGDDPRRFTAERVFDLEYADDPRISPDGSSLVTCGRSTLEAVSTDHWLAAKALVRRFAGHQAEIA